MKYLLSIFLIFSLIACSGSKSVNEVEESADGIELADSDEFSEESEDSIDDDLMGDSEDFMMEDTAEETVQGAVEQEPAMQEEPMFEAAAATGMEESAQIQIDQTQQGSYTVVKNDTLMMVAFKIYGDYAKWKSIARENADTLAGNNNLTVGMNLRYTMPSEPFNWNPEGNPYLIKLGDTLGTISTDTYGVEKYWKNIWDNNKPLIKDPNKIFAGFTIYTPVLDGSR